MLRVTQCGLRFPICRLRGEWASATRLCHYEVALRCYSE